MDVSSLTPKQQLILTYLEETVDGLAYIKSKQVSQHLELSSKEVGTNMPAIINAETNFEIEKWGYSTGTTWKVTRKA